MSRRQVTFINDPPVQFNINDNTGSTGIVRTTNVFIFIPDKPEPTSNRLVNFLEDE